MPSPIHILEFSPTSARDRRRFLRLPFRLYRDIPQWVPPLAFEAGRVFDRRQPFYRNGEAVFLLALDGQERVVGRLAVLNNHKYNAFNHEQSAFFYLFECENDPAAAQALFEHAVGWARARGLNKLSGPKGFTALDGMGLLVKGFEHRPAFGLPYNPPYYPALVEAAGFSPCGELVSGYLNRQLVTLPDKVRRVAELVQQRRGLRVVRFKQRRDLLKLIPGLQKMYNEALEGTTGNIPLTEQDLRSMADQLLWFADPRLIKIIQKDDELAGFLLAYPDISAAVQRCRGQLFPFGWLDILLETRRTQWVNINGAAIVEKYRGLGGTALLFTEMADTLLESSFEHADLVQIGTDNEKMQLELRSMGIDFYKCHRMYQISI